MEFSDDAFRDRLEKFLKAESMSAMKFAEIMEIRPSNISHFMNGRNKPNFDFLARFIRRFPEISIPWFLNGDGEMYAESAAGSPSPSSFSSQQEPVSRVPLNLFSFDDEYPSDQPEPAAPSSTPETQTSVSTPEPQTPTYTQAPASTPAPQTPTYTQAPASTPAPQIPAYTQAPASTPAPQIPAYIQAPASTPAPQTPTYIQEQQTPTHIPEQQTPSYTPEPLSPVNVVEPQTPVSMVEQQASVSVPEPQMPAYVDEPQAPVSMPEPKTPVQTLQTEQEHADDVHEDPVESESSQSVTLKNPEAAVPVISKIVMFYDDGTFVEYNRK